MNLNLDSKDMLRLSNTSKAFSTCSGAIVLFSSLLQTSLDSEEIRFINSAKPWNRIRSFIQYQKKTQLEHIS